MSKRESNQPKEELKIQESNASMRSKGSKSKKTSVAKENGRGISMMSNLPNGSKGQDIMELKVPAGNI